MLAMVGNGVDTGYSIRKYLLRTKGSRWSSESGGVYRALRRLANHGLLTELPAEGPKGRERQCFRLSDRGRKALDAWLVRAPSTDEMFYLVDPLRTRFYFLDRLPVADQIATVKRWIAENANVIQSLVKDRDTLPQDRPLYALGFNNYVMMAHSRQQWLEEVLVALEAGVAAPNANHTAG